MANFISIIRIVLSFSLAVIRPLSLTFYAIYLVCIISDILDGYIARRTHTESNLGEKLDSFADLILVAVLMIVLYPFVNPTAQIIIWVGIIGVIRAVSIIVVLIKYKTFTILHTYGNKITGVILAAYPLSLAFTHSDVLMKTICVIASISALEELFIHLSSVELRTNKKSIFQK